MDIMGILFLIIGLMSAVGSFMLEGGHINALGEPTAAIMVIGGTIGAVGLSFPVHTLKKLPAIIKIAFGSKSRDMVEVVAYFKELAYKTRKNGLLSIEGELGAEGLDPFTKKGLQLVVDGVEPQAVKSILDLELESTYERHKEGSAIFEAAGGFGPTMGIIGTVMGLVHVLSNLDDPSTLGPKIAVAFIATLYGVGTANLIYLPIGSRLKEINNEEIKEKQLILEAVLLIQEGVNPNTLGEKLKSFLDKAQVEKINQLDKGGAE